MRRLVVTSLTRTQISTKAAKTRLDKLKHIGHFHIVALARWGGFISSPPKMVNGSKTVSVSNDRRAKTTI